MHAVVMESLEEYLAGSLEPAAQRDIEAHLNGCQMCREELKTMQDVSALFGSLRPEEAPAPPAGFYASVMRQVREAPAPAPSVASLFTFDFAFGRRLAFASLLTLAVLGSFLFTREAESPGDISPDAVMAQQDLPAFDTAPASANMLVTLTSYER